MFGLGLGLLAGCGSVSPPAPVAPTTATATSPAPAIALCRPLRSRVVGRVESPLATELSGLARGRDGVLYAQNDSGNAARVLVLDARTARVLGAPVVTGARNVDWEDVATLRTRARGRELLLADIGDNAASRDSVAIDRVPEPAASAAATAPATVDTLRYPDGAHDAEALIADPLRDELTIVTKGLFDGRAYRIAAARSGTLVRGPQIPIGLVTAGSISADGTTVALRSYTELAIWRRHGREPVTRTLARSPDCRQELASEGQGEALALDAGAVLTVPEGKDPALRRYAPR